MNATQAVLIFAFVQLLAAAPVRSSPLRRLISARRQRALPMSDSVGRDGGYSSQASATNSAAASGGKGLKGEARQVAELDEAIASLIARLDAGLPPGSMRAITATIDGGLGRFVRASIAISAVTGCRLRDALAIAASAIRAQEEIQTSRKLAMAGPRATVWVLSALPVVAICLGVALGANPVGVLIDGGVGSVLAAVGIGLAAIGWLWSRALIAQVARAGEMS